MYLLNDHLKHRFKRNHSAVREISVHLKTHVQRLVLVLMNCQSVYQHSQVCIGDSSLGQYVVKQRGSAFQSRLALFANLIVLAAVVDFPFQLRNLTLAFFNHIIVEFRAGFVRDLAHNQVLDLLFQREDFFFILPNL